MSRRPLLLAFALLVAAGSASAQTGILVQATATLPQGCRALLSVDKKEQDVYLVRREGDHIFFRYPNAPANALVALRLDTIESVEFPFEIDASAAFEATRSRQWQKAAEILLAVVNPCLPFIELPKNNGAEPALEAGLYLMRAAAAASREQQGAVTPAAQALYERALQVFHAVARADWFPRKEQARLRASLCQTACGRLEEAQRLFDAARIPDPGDGDFGLWQLARASLFFARGQMMEACNAAARSLVFENKDPQVFPDALLLSARCYEELMDYYRARDVYYETARLFGSTEWGEIALARLTFVMDNQLTAEKEKANIAKVFFGSEEDMDKVVRAFLKRRADEAEQAKKASK